jgi:purine nucleoside phosphorylase
MSIGIITGSGTDTLPGYGQSEPVVAETPFGDCAVTRGGYEGVDALHVSRHGPGHARLSSHVNHKANIWALKELGATSVIGCTACGAVDPTLELGSLVVFDDLHFISNRLPDGSLCTFFTEPGDPRRGHWILDGGPYSIGVREALLAAARGAPAAATTESDHPAATEADHPVWDGGTYGHVDGPRFNTPAEIAQLAAAGVTAVSQTAGPETVLCGELELPYALIGFVSDYANEVRPAEPTPIATLLELMGQSTTVFADVLRGALPRLQREPPVPTATVYRFEG